MREEVVNKYSKVDHGESELVCDYIFNGKISIKTIVGLVFFIPDSKSTKNIVLKAQVKLQLSQFLILISIRCFSFIMFISSVNSKLVLQIKIKLIRLDVDLWQRFSNQVIFNIFEFTCFHKKYFYFPLTWHVFSIAHPTALFTALQLAIIPLHSWVSFVTQGGV